MSETAVALTDYGLVAECGAFVAWLTRGAPPSVERDLWRVFLGATGLAALTGGTYHAFFPGTSTGVGEAIWIATLLAIGAAAAAALLLAESLRHPPTSPPGVPPPPGGPPVPRRAALDPVSHRSIRAIAAGAVVVYLLLVAFVTRAFLLAVAFYLPAALFWLWMLVAEQRRFRDRASLLGVIGLVLSFVAAGVQTAHVSIAATHLDSNSLYHLIQAAGLLLLFLCARGQLAHSA